MRNATCWELLLACSESIRLTWCYNFTFTLTVQEVREAKVGLSAVQLSARIKGSDSFFLHTLPIAISLALIFSENGVLERKYRREKRKEKRAGGRHQPHMFYISSSHTFIAQCHNVPPSLWYCYFPLKRLIQLNDSRAFFYFKKYF